MTIREDTSVVLEQQVAQALQHNPYLMRKSVSCQTEDGRVVIRGEVGSYFQKQMATEAIRRLGGIEEIDNQLQVTWS